MPNALGTSSIVLPREVVSVIGEKVKDASTIAALSPAEPRIFDDKNYIVFNGDAEAEVVAEGDAKGYYTPDPNIAVATTTTIQTTTRVSAQLRWADEDNRLEIIRAIQEDQARALARALDYIVYHAINPKSGQAISGYTALTAMATVNKVYLGAALAAATDAELVESIDLMAEAVNTDFDIDGVALAKTYANALRKVRIDGVGPRAFGEIPINLNVGNLEGIPAACSGTVSGTRALSPTGVLGIMGDFGMIRWGLVRDMRAEVIEYGDPDNQGDLKRYNQIALRTEAVLAHAVLDADAFAVLYSGEGGGTTTTTGA